MNDPAELQSRAHGFIQAWRAVTMVQVSFVTLLIVYLCYYTIAVYRIRGEKFRASTLIVAASYLCFMLYISLDIGDRFAEGITAGVPWRTFLAFLGGTLGDIAFLWKLREVYTEYKQLEEGSK